jgi:cell division protein FtsL
MTTTSGMLRRVRQNFTNVSKVFTVNIIMAMMSP